MNSDEKQKSKDEKAPTPQIYAGLKFFDSMMKKVNEISFFSMQGDLYAWYNSIAGYVSMTKAYMSKEKKDLVDKELDKIYREMINYTALENKLGNRRFVVYNTLRVKMMQVQTLVFGATENLMVRVSQGDSDELDFIALSRGE